MGEVCVFLCCGLAGDAVAIFRMPCRLRFSSCRRVCVCIGAEYEETPLHTPDDICDWNSGAELALEHGAWVHRRWVGFSTNFLRCAAVQKTESAVFCSKVCFFRFSFLENGVMWGGFGDDGATVRR